MASILPDFEYDIFISYRQNDNRSGWVSDFVKALEEELAATIKFPVSIYFDSNPQDGLLETHHVHRSLEGKLRCLIFMPILSQTYCDTSSFAWKHEFCVFNKMASADRLGREIQLHSGNVASRILPIKIHDLDAEDRNLIEKEIGSILRPIEFIYKRAGVNRPLLKHEEHPHDNLNKHLYRDQINKVANAVKEILVALRTNPPTQKPPEALQKRSKRKTVPVLVILGILGLLSLTYWIYCTNSQPSLQPEVRKPRIAILPFSVIGGPEGEYFATGMKEVLVKHLRINNKLSVPPSLVSTERFQNSILSPSEIAMQLEADYLVKAATQKWTDSIRINIELIDPINDKSLWIHEYKTSFDNVFQVQENIAQGISNALTATLTNPESQKLKRIPTQNLEAYDNYLRARALLLQFFAGREESTRVEATRLLRASISLDPTFGEPYIELAGIYFTLNEKADSIEYLIDKGLELAPDYGAAYDIKSQYLLLIKHDTTQSLSVAEKGIEIDPYSIELIMWQGFLYHYWFKDGREIVGLQKYLDAYRLNPDNVWAPLVIWNIGVFFTHIRDHSRAEYFLHQALSMQSDNINQIMDFTAWHYFLTGNFNALKSIIEKMKELHDRKYPNNYRHLYWSAVHGLYTNQPDLGLEAHKEYCKYANPENLFSIYTLLLNQTGKQAEAKKMWLDFISREKNNDQPDHLMLARCYSMLNEPEKALDHLEQIPFTHTHRMQNPDFYLRDLMLAPLHNEPRFKKIVQPELDRLKQIQERIAKMEKEGLIEIPRFIQN